MNVVSVDRKSARRRAADVGGLRVTDVAFRPAFASPLHVHERDCLTVVLGGAMAKDERELSGGAVALTPAWAPHVDRFGDTGGRVVVIEHGEDLHARDLDALRLPWHGQRLAAELAATDAAAPLALHAAALELLAVVARAESRPSAWLDDVVEHLDGRLFERVTLADLAAVGGVHRTHLVRAFRARFGLSVGAYVRRERIRWAAQALRANELTLAEIALHAGFSDQSHFTRVFTGHMGVSPGRYRRG